MPGKMKACRICLKTLQNLNAVGSEIQPAFDQNLGFSSMGKVFDIQKFSVNDGPGIRTLVFFKGCPLRCQWCSNPESQQSRFELMHYQNICDLCAKCTEVCPNGQIIIKNNQRVYDTKGCLLCGKCVDTCSKTALRLAGRDETVSDIVSITKQDYLFYLNSGGGVTIGGGEPLMQPAFLKKLLFQLKEIGIHTAIETCGYAEWEVFNSIFQYLDLLLYDLKHIDSEKHLKFTGKSNKRILDNLSKLLIKDTSVIIRIPLIPGFNDDSDTIRGICSFLSDNDVKKTINRVDLLPYHKLGTNKYQALARNYELKTAETQIADDIKGLEEIVQSFGFESRIEIL